MSKLKEKFPFFEIASLLFANICTVVVSLIIFYFFDLEQSGEENLFTTKEDALSFLPWGTANILLPFFTYILVCYLSQNRMFLRFWHTLKNSLKNKILMCVLLFITSPIPVAVIIFSIFLKHVDLNDLLLNFPLSMGFPLMLFFIFEPIVTQMVGKHFEKHPNSKSWLKKNYDLRMEIQKELSLNS